MTSTPSQRALRAEARAWRRAARGTPIALAVTLFLCPEMRTRWKEHYALSDPRIKPTKHSGPMACLFLALECESDASRVPPESAR